MTRAPYANNPSASRGRLYAHVTSATRSEFQRDRDRIVHASAFRRLMHKTQVFVAVEGDHYRTRLTHSLEVAQIARSLARVLDADEDLAEALALAHDLGHTAFGHAGEDALDARMQPWGGFDHNAQALRIVTELEQRYPDFNGLNLTWEMLEGLVKHNGPLPKPSWGIAQYQSHHDLWLHSHAGLEAQIAAMADDIAYNAHDLDDGLRANLFSIDDVLIVPLVADCWSIVTAQWPTAPDSRRIPELVRQMIGRFVDDLLHETKARLAAGDFVSADDIRLHGRTVVRLSPAMQEQERILKQFLRKNMYRHPLLVGRSVLAEKVIGTLFEIYLDDPRMLPATWQSKLIDVDVIQKARHISDFIAGCTDRYALRLYGQLTGNSIDLADFGAITPVDENARRSCAP
jgi:dGTPase